jgi:hypothetical protein
MAKHDPTSKAGAAMMRIVASLGLCACGAQGGAPSMEPIDDQLAVVGQELVINLRATDPDGDDLVFDYSAPIEGVTADVARRPDGTGVFRWTPVAEHLGTWFFDFTVHDDDGSDTVTVVIDVRATSGEGSAPIFREPLGSGTTLDLERAGCLDLPVVVEDQDSTEVSLGQQAPIIDGAAVVQESGLSGRWSWCPSKAQLGEDRYPLTLSADDGVNPAVLKNYLIVLRQAPKSDCPGEAPVVVHSPRDWDEVLDIEIVADVTDDVGLKRAPLLYFTTVEPKIPIDFSVFDVQEMELSSGDLTSGQWRGTIPNPVAAAAVGSAAPVWYILSASDDDDTTGDCDHLTDQPSEGAHQITVTNTGGSGGAGLCEACSADVQCGAAADLCLAVGNEGDTFCGTSCETSTECAPGYGCVQVGSVGGVSARQCVPTSGTCDDAPPPMCTDDAFEDNDSLGQASGGPVLGVGNYDLVSCPAAVGDDEDWFRISVPADTRVDVSVAGGNASDLDLALLAANGNVVATSTSAGSSESISVCTGTGTHYIRAFTGNPADNDYTLTYAQDVGACALGCVDDDHEQDDNIGSATYAEVFPDPYAAVDRQICSGDDDYYEIELLDGETIAIDLTFVQSNGNEDIDLHFFDNMMVDVTPCDEATPATCTVAQGQSATSNEHYEYTVSNAACASGCTFWVMVHGWDGSENDYDITMELQ